MPYIAGSSRSPILFSFGLNSLISSDERGERRGKDSESQQTWTSYYTWFTVFASVSTVTFIQFFTPQIWHLFQGWCLYEGDIYLKIGCEKELFYYLYLTDKINDYWFLLYWGCSTYSGAVLINSFCFKCGTYSSKYATQRCPHKHHPVSLVSL